MGRKASQFKVNAALQTKLNQVAGLRIQAVPLPSLPVGGKGLPIDFEITTISDFPALMRVTDAIIKEAKASGLFMFINSTLSYDKTQLDILLSRSKAAQMGIQMSEVGTALGSLLGGYGDSSSSDSSSDDDSDDSTRGGSQQRATKKAKTATSAGFFSVQHYCTLLYWTAKFAHMAQIH